MVSWATEHTAPVAFAQLNPLAWGERTQLVGANPHAHQAQRGMPDGGGHATHLPIASLDEFEADPAIGDGQAVADGRHARRDIGLGLQQPCPARASKNPLHRDPSGKTCKGIRPGHAFHLSPIDARMGGGRIEKAAVQAGFIRQEQQALRVGVEPTEGIDTRRQPKAGQRPVGRAVRGELAQDSEGLV